MVAAAAIKVPTPWELASDDVISVILKKPTAWEIAYLQYGLRPEHMPTVKQRRMYEAACALVKAGKPLSDALILEHAGSAVTLSDIGIWLNMFDEYRYEVFEHNIELVKEKGLSARLPIILDKGKEMARSQSRTEVMRYVITELSGLGHETNVQGETARELSTELDSLFETAPTTVFRTGLTWFDETAGGIAPAKFWGLAAPYKSRKTTVALNLMVSMIMFAHQKRAKMPSIAFMSGEMPRTALATNLIAMLAAAYVHDLKMEGRREKEKQPTLDYITGEMLLLAGQTYKRWPSLKVKAIEWARETFRSVFAKHVRIYDKSDKGGGITDYDALENAIYRDIALYGTDLIIVDYLQNFTAPGEKGSADKADFIRNTYGSELFQEIVTSKGVSMFVLAQKNEASVGSSKKNYSPGIKGGNKFSSAVDYLVESFYHQNGAPDTELNLVMKLGRSIGTGETSVQIHPSSGLILDNSWQRGISG